jgi:hypothetical protein
VLVSQRVQDAIKKEAKEKELPVAEVSKRAQEILTVSLSFSLSFSLSISYSIDLTKIIRLWLAI